MASAEQVKSRAKVYLLDKADDGTEQWIDNGTGHARIDYDEVKFYIKKKQNHRMTQIISKTN